MAKRESIWKANDGAEHRSKQSKAVADAEQGLRELVAVHGRCEEDPAVVSADVLLMFLGEFATEIYNVIKARAALAKHEAKGE